MTLEAIVITSDKAPDIIEHKGYNNLDSLGGPTTIAAKIDEIFNALTEPVRNSISDEAELTIEISGSISLKGEAGGKWLVFNIGTSATKSDSVKVVIKTKIKPINR